MKREDRQVQWTEVAAFYLTCYLRRSSVSDRRGEFERFRELKEAQIERLLEGETHRGAKVPHYLKEKGYTWWDTTLPLADLQMGPGSPSTDYRKAWQELESGKHMRVETFCQWLNSKSLSELLEMDDCVTSFIPTGRIPEFLRRIIVGEADREHPDVKGRILDGYHRAIVLYLFGEREVAVYLGRKENAQPQSDREAEIYDCQME